jgi:hypothetical protein
LATFTAAIHVSRVAGLGRHTGHGAGTVTHSRSAFVAAIVTIPDPAQ